MSSNLQDAGFNFPLDFPNDRIHYSGKDGPLFDNDVQAALESLLYSITVILGLPTTGASAFAILSGFPVVGNSSGNNIFGPGIVYMCGQIYYSNVNISASQYIAGYSLPVASQPYSDTVSRYTYEIFYAQPSAIQWQEMPVFLNNMDQYRLNLNILNASITTLNNNITAVNNNITAITDNYGHSAGNVPIIGASDLVASQPLLTDANQKITSGTFGKDSGDVLKVGGATLDVDTPLSVDSSGNVQTLISSLASPPNSTTNNFASGISGSGVVDLITVLNGNKMALLYIGFTAVSTVGYQATLTIQKNGETNNNNNINLYSTVSTAGNPGFYYGQVWCPTDAFGQINIYAYSNIAVLNYFIVQAYI